MGLNTGMKRAKREKEAVGGGVKRVMKPVLVRVAGGNRWERVRHVSEDLVALNN